MRHSAGLRVIFNSVTATADPVDALHWSLSWVLCIGLCLTEGPLLHVPRGSLSAAVLKRALSSRLTTFPRCSEGLTVLLGLNEEEFALPWQRISHSPWQLWQLVMAACWWELCKPSSCHCHNCHHQPSTPPLQSFVWGTWNARISFFSLYTIRTTKYREWK